MIVRLSVEPPTAGWMDRAPCLCVWPTEDTAMAGIWNIPFVVGITARCPEGALRPGQGAYFGIVV